MADAGNGFLLRQGYSILWCGWNGDVKGGDGRLLIQLPVAFENGKMITGKIYAEICVDQKSFRQPFSWGNSNPYPAVSLDNGLATLTMRPVRSEPAVAVPRDQWAFDILYRDLDRILVAGVQRTLGRVCCTHPTVAVAALLGAEHEASAQTSCGSSHGLR